MLQKVNAAPRTRTLIAPRQEGNAAPCHVIEPEIRWPMYRGMAQGVTPEPQIPTQILPRSRTIVNHELLAVEFGKKPNFLNSFLSPNYTGSTIPSIIPNYT
jgi:hypothetical protein